MTPEKKLENPKLENPIELTDAELDAVSGGDNPHGERHPTGDPHLEGQKGNPHV